ncbi:unnamed protein product [Hyaloperonospora brassicae]|uniref:Uncharacterized protein n=1 Tax=Hyaloperonospora brassicae TaxID=162125 RepID=A0AAV0TDN8_HYABA|nr:unnamed protein product [Hyaloperonospora brassicae]
MECPDAFMADDACGVHFAERIPATEFERQAVEVTAREVARLNAAVRARPAIGARSTFFQDEQNVARGLPVFQGTHTRFVYDEEAGEEIVAVVDVTREALEDGPVVRTVAELDVDVGAEDDDEDRDEEEDRGEEEEEEEERTGELDAVCSADEGCAMVVVDDVHVDTLMEDVEMEMAAVALDERKLMEAAAKRL